MLVQAIKLNETKGAKECHNKKGDSGEAGCLQYMRSTYEGYSLQTLGYIAPYTAVNAEYVALLKIQTWIGGKQTDARIMQNWNQGERAGKCAKGTNKYGVRFDSCGYVVKGLSIIKSFTAYASE